MEDAEKNTIVESLLLKRREERRKNERIVSTCNLFIEEAKRVGYVGAPMAAVTISLLLLQVVAMMMIGHLGELALSSSAIAISLSAVTGSSLLIGMASALETLCGQAYGAKQFHKMGNYTYTAIISLTFVAFLLSILWANMGKLLTLTGQDPVISYEAGRFIRWLIPTLFSNAIFQPLVRFHQTQSLVKPLLISSFITVSLHIPLCWVLVFKSGLQNLGGALAICVSNWLNVAFLVLYTRYSSACSKTRAPISTEIFHCIGEFFRFAIPSALMLCLQWWSYEFIILLSGLLPNPQLETSVLSVCLTTITTMYAIPYGLSAAVSTRVSNELGAGKPEAASRAVYTVLSLAVTELLIVGGTLLASRKIFGYIFSNEIEVVKYVSSMAPLVCLSVIADGLQGVFSGIARGCGWQNTGAAINLASLYLCGIPVSAILGFWWPLKGRGLWIGVVLGAMLQNLLLCIVTACTNWETQASKARKRLHEEGSSVASS